MKEIMTMSPACCTPEASLQEVAQMLVENDCGAIPVVDSQESLRPIGIVTDRDIACRAVAKGKDALGMTARECMSSPSLTASEDASLEECCRVMEANRVRRLPVVDDRGRCRGIVSQADIARHASGQKTAEVLKKVSQPTVSASAMH